MYANRVKVLHVADHDTVVVRIPHNLIFNFLHAGDALLHQTLADRAVADPRLDGFAQLFLIVANPAAGSAQCISRTDDQRVPDSGSEAHSFFHTGDDCALRYRLLQLTHQLAEQIAVLSLLDGFQLCTQQLHVLLLQYACTGQLHSHIQAGLSAQCWQQSIGTLLADNCGHKFKSNRLDVYLISHIGIGHNSGRVAVDQHNLNAFFLQRLAGLCSRIVKLSGLPDHDRAGADDEDFFKLIVLWHVIELLSRLQA
ncbi:hypothetical protein D3C75_773660 [compost metagenome]